MSPFSSINANLSTSGSTTIPKSALCFFTSSDKSVKCSFKGSGLCGKCPFGSQYNLITSTPKRSNNKGIAIPPVEFTPSTTTLNRASSIDVTVTNGKSKTSIICKSIYALFFVIFPKLSTSAKFIVSLSAISKILAPSSPSRNSPSEFNNFNAFHCFGL